MKVRRAFVGVVAITIVYLIALTWVDSRNEVLASVPQLMTKLPVLGSLAFMSYLIRYLRWYWLLARAGNRTNVFYGFLAYMAGFAFTATPGKVGELLRIRYLAPQGVPPWKILAAFVYERGFDLVVLLILAGLAIGRKDVFVVALSFVVVLLFGVVLVAHRPAWLTRAAAYLRFYQLRRFARVCTTLRDGLGGARIWTTPLDVLVSLGTGGVAWTLISFSFLWLLEHLSVSLPVLSALAIYPSAMLAGAASMLPGGVGSTEVVTVVLLSMFDVPLATATLAAIGIRVSSMWFAVLCGFVALGTLELRLRKME
jgi:uncharacterized protein (TIRG00374 family)